MQPKQPYNLNMNIKFPPLELIDVGAEAEAVTQQWFNQTLTKVNDCVVRMGVFLGEFHFHKHDIEDEFFFVIQGRLWVDFEDKSVELLPQQGITVPRGVIHKTRALERTVVIMIEGAGVVPTGD